MTEDEARQKWCPMGRVPLAEDGVVTQWQGGGFNRFPEGPEPRCIASGCMLWRWYKKDLDQTRAINGYCGLAGKPHA